MSEEPLLEEDGPAAARKRRCVSARASRPAAGMIRFVVGPDDALVPDLAGRLPGRGLWLTADRGAVQAAVSRNLFAKAAQGRVTAPADLADRLEAMLVRRCLDLVGLARRAGEVVVGFDQVVDLLRHGRAALVLQARDAAADGRRKVRAAAGEAAPVVEAFDRAELGGSVGRAETVHLALVPGGVERRLRTELGRLSGFRAFTAPSAGEGDATEREEGISRI